MIQAKEGIFLMDGAMGTELISHFASKVTYPLDRYNETHPEVVSRIHQEYLLAGSDIIKANSFNGTHLKEAWQLADKCRQDVNPQAKIICVIGPEYNDDKLAEALLYPWDYILIETIMDLKQAHHVFDFLNSKSQIPIMVSATLTLSGKLFSGETLKDYAESFRLKNLASLGLNCSHGAKILYQYLKELKKLTHHPLSFHANINKDESLDNFIHYNQKIIEENLVQFIGGCCGTNPSDIKKIAELLMGTTRTL